MIWDEQRKEIARNALRRWHGTPYKNRIAVVGVGVDCINLVCEILYEAQVIPRASFSGYDTDLGMWAESTRLQDTMLRCLNAEWVTSDFEFGDIFIMKTGTRSAHCGFYSDDGYIWHSLSRRCVTRSDFSLWKREILGMVRIVKTGFRMSPNNMRFE